MQFSNLKTLKFLALGLCALSLASCESWESARLDAMEGMDTMYDSVDDAANTASSMPMRSEDYLRSDCPSVKLVDELGTFSDFTNFRQPNNNTLITRVNVAKLASSCTFTEKSVTVDIQLAFEGRLGPAARRGPQDTFYSYPFFVAITSPNGLIMAREIFAAPMTYMTGQDRQVHHENMRQIIPISKKEHAQNYNILIGFQLNKQQLAYNRESIKTQKKLQKPRSANIPVPQEERNSTQQGPQTTIMQPVRNTQPTPLAPPASSLNR